MSNEFCLAVLDPTDNRGYLQKRIPDRRDKEIGELISRVLKETQVARFSHSIEARHAVVLRVYAERMASTAVRTRDYQLLRLGLVGLLLTNCEPESRETLTIFPLIIDALRKLSVEPAALVSSVRLLIGEQLTRPFVDFANRSEVEKSLQIMGYKEGVDDEGFRYIRCW